MKSAHIAAAGLTVLAGLALASAASAQTVEIKNAVARVVVIPEARTDVGVEVIQGRSGLPAVEVSRRGGKVEITGNLPRRVGGSSPIRRCRSGDPQASQPGLGAEVTVQGIGQVRLDDAPMIVLRTPPQVDVNARGAIYGAVGPGAQSLDLGHGGCGQWTVANVAGPAEVSVAGSGGIRMGSSESLAASIGGSGDIQAQAVGTLEANIGGSGDIRVARVNGPIDINVGGAGNVLIEDGRSQAVDVAIAGSGNVRFDGTAQRLSVAVVGSGDVYVREVTGPVSRSVMGSGKVRIGD